MDRSLYWCPKMVQLLPSWCLPGPSDQKPPHSVWAGGRQAVSCFTGNKQALRRLRTTTVPSEARGQGAPRETEVALLNMLAGSRLGKSWMTSCGLSVFVLVLDLMWTKPPALCPLWVL